ncbi:lipopolysaccharide biosynthesis protein [Ideonella sp. 4Y11]|uniref:Lipopolysaccharide biosynthesis protein n=1 Tax=Ideonella aquatica TaxID=2824119 RepID=A0A940YIA8_9BURK|nr:Wzz/FepE/Etk N-terminal domain-containing protein [Ideonella aquatica]MBQ0958339.1 lipopolysaccharide biosynthesis protein [Ideonella aquatica]
MNTHLQPMAAAKPAREVTFLDMIHTILVHWKMLILVPLAAGSLALGGTYLVTPRFTASAQITTPQNQNLASALLGNLGGAAGALAGGLTAGLKNPADQWIGLLKSRAIADALIERFDLKQRYGAQFMFEARESLAGASRISVGKDGLIDIEVEDTDPKLAADLANAYLEELQKLARQMALSDAAQRRSIFEGLLRKAKDDFTRAEQALRATGVNESLMKISPTAAMQGLAALKQSEIAAEVKLSVLRSALADSSPEVLQTKRELSGIRAQLAKLDQTSAAAAGDSDYSAKFRDFQYHSMLFELTAKQFELARIDEASGGAVVQVIDRASVPEWKSSPKRGVIALVTAVLSLFVCLTWLVFKAQLAATADDAATAEKLERIKALWRR